MRTSTFDYELPADRIAQEPAPNREDARLLVLDRASGTRAHRRIPDLSDHLHEGDLLVVNDVRVEHARLRGRKESGGRVEALLLEPLNADTTNGTAGSERWKAMLGASRTPQPGARLLFDADLVARVEDKNEDGSFILTLEAPDDVAGRRERAGQLPLPPYIQRPEGPTAIDENRYQTVYARNPGAVAAPTAGLHLTEHLLARLQQSGVGVTSLTLRVGPGTFRPVKVEDPTRHVMHEEEYAVSDETAWRIEETRRGGGRIVAVGTTTLRVLETLAGEGGTITAGEGRTGLFVLPGFSFRVVDVLLTNFHLPRSTLLMLVCAFGGTRNVLSAYREAVAEGYRFYSYGDAMLLL